MAYKFTGISKDILGTNQKLKANPSIINAMFQNAYGRAATAAELKRFAGKTVADVGTGVFGKQYQTAYDKTNATPSPAAVTPPPAAATSTIPGYEDWLKGAGSSYANAYSQDYLNQEYDPYFNKQLGGLNEEQRLAQEALGRNLQTTTENTGLNFNERGLYGSGIYNKQLDESLDTLNRGYQEQYGSGEYTPFTLRKNEIEQQRKIAKESASLGRQGQAFQAYQQQYYPLMSGA